LQGLLSDLETLNTLSVLLCEQIAESIFWMRRYVEDKELILMEATAEKLVIGRFMARTKRTNERLGSVEIQRVRRLGKLIRCQRRPISQIRRTTQEIKK